MGIGSWLGKANDDILFTPGPLTTSRSVKMAMLRDLGSRDSEFLQITRSVCDRLVQIAEVNEKKFVAVLMQGSGTFGVESVLTSVIPEDGKVLIISNGVYGKRMAEICHYQKIRYKILDYKENEEPQLQDIEKCLDQDSQFTHVAMVHCETTSGMINPVAEVGALCKRLEKSFILDGISTFGAVPIEMERWSVDYLIGSCNKCLEGVPGLAFIIARRDCLQQTEGRARSLSLDLYAQWKGLESANEFRYTPPIQVILALDQALDELEEEGGIRARGSRYQENYDCLVQGMVKLGFKPYLPGELRGSIITSFNYLSHSLFDYKDFYFRIKQRGYVIYSGKVSNAQCFRIGNIGRIGKSDILNLLSAVRETLHEMEILK